MNAQKSFKENKIFSVFPDLKEERQSDNIFEIAEKILIREKNNAKNALEELWALKNGMDASTRDQSVEHVERLIDHYQNKMDALREKEETLLRVSEDSRKLFAEKMQKDEELERVKKERVSSEQELMHVQKSLEKLSVRLQELQQFEQRAQKSLAQNEAEIIDGLYEITLLKKTLSGKAVETPPVRTDIFGREIKIPVTSAKAAITIEPEQAGEKLVPRPEKPAEIPVFPKSVVKTNDGRIIGEYYYDPQVEKSGRQYIFNGKYFIEQMQLGIEKLGKTYDEMLHTQLLQMATDCLNRISKKDTIHFEIATNEILNGKTVAEMLVALRVRNYDVVHTIILRYNAKVEALAGNYERILMEQMERFGSR